MTATRRRAAARDAALRLLNRLTVGAGLASIAAVALFGAASAETNPGTSTSSGDQASTAASSGTAQSSTSSTGTSSGASSSTSSSGLQQSSGVSSSSGMGVVVSGGSR